MPEARKVDPYEANELFGYVDAMVRSDWPSDEIAITLLALGYQPPATKPDIETVAAAVHVAWMEAKREQGVTSRLSEWGEEQMVPYADLSERAKDLDRVMVRSVYAAMEKASNDGGWKHG